MRSEARRNPVFPKVASMCEWCLCAAGLMFVNSIACLEVLGNRTRRLSVVAVTLAWMKLLQVPRFIRWGKPVEELVRDDPAMVERRRKDFHFEFTTLRFRAIGEYGDWEGWRGIVPI